MQKPKYQNLNVVLLSEQLLIGLLPVVLVMIFKILTDLQSNNWTPISLIETGECNENKDLNFIEWFSSSVGHFKLKILEGGIRLVAVDMNRKITMLEAFWQTIGNGWSVRINPDPVFLHCCAIFTWEGEYYLHFWNQAAMFHAGCCTTDWNSSVVYQSIIASWLEALTRTDMTQGSQCLQF